MMDADRLLMVSGTVLRSGNGLRIPRGDETIEISGADVPGLEEILAAAVPASVAELSRHVLRHGDENAAAATLDALIEAQVLVEVRPARSLVGVRGELGPAVDAACSGLYWPASQEPVSLVYLGVLGTAAWHEAASSVEARAAVTFACSLEKDGSGWVLPLSPERGRPCPLCLGARRVAVDDPPGGDAIVVTPAHLQSLAWHAVRWAVDAPPDAVLHVRGATARTRMLIPFSHCRRCGAARREGPPPLPAEERPEPSPALREALLDNVIGPFFLNTHSAPDTFRDLPLVLGGLRTLQAAGAGFRRRVVDTSFGAGLTESRARLVCLAETIERYAALMERPDVRNRTFAELAPDAVDPATIIRYTDEQYASPTFPFARHAGEPLDWGWVHELVADRPMLLPFDALASRGWLPFEGRPLMNEPTSHGTAVHRSFARAANRSIFEWVERDALMLAWYLRLPLPQLAVPSFDDDTAAVRSYLHERGIHLRFHNLAVDFDIPTVLCLAASTQSRGRWPAGGLLLSACSGPTWPDAIAHGVREILGHYLAFACVEGGDSPSTEPDPEAGPYLSLLTEYMRPENAGAFSFLGTDAAPPDEHSACRSSYPDEILAWLKQRFAARRLPLYARCLGTDDPVTGGLVVVKTVAPGLLRIAVTRELVNFGEPRIEEVRRRWNVDGPLNPRIHPIS